mgnify:CR=1 FL=1
MNKNSGRIWPYSIGGAIILVFGFCVATVVVTSNAHIQESNAYMTYYQDADTNANDLINNRIAFDKKYKINYVPAKLHDSESVVGYKVTDLNSKTVNNAKLTILVSRPETHEFDQKLSDAKLNDGVYSFSNVKFPRQGVWDIIVKVEVEKLSRFYNVKVDTRNTNYSEY